jgi:XTP/dITP diphosphohydrolase
LKLILASNNKGKLREMREILADLDVEVVSQSEAGLTLEAEENGTTFHENARIKALAACKALGLPAMADDSGIVVDALNGEPGIYSARYGGDKCKNDRERLEYLLKNMEDKENRAARFVSSIVCVFPNGDEISAESAWEGELLREPVGEGGFGYDPIFYSPEFKKSSGELTAEEKNSVSHRGKALRIFEE